jgi:hypothetical protein
VLGEGRAARWIGGSFPVTLAKNRLDLLDQSITSPTHKELKNLVGFGRFELKYAHGWAELISIAVLFL